jgi:hypothetical protein
MTPGSIDPVRVPMGSPSSAVKPMVVAMERPAAQSNAIRDKADTMHS